jgi:ribosomal protein S18 acetylase RimI-like enzyme
MTERVSPVLVRVARASDEAQLARLDRISWSPQSGFPSVMRQAGTVFFLTESPPQAFLVAEIDGVMVGYVRLGSPLPLPENAHVVGVLGLAVAPEARRRGVGTALLTAAEQRARGRGARKLSLRTFSTNPEAIRLYTRFGFEREGLLRAEFLIEGQYVDDLLLAKDLTGPPANGAAG